MRKDFSFVFWLHLVLIITAWMSPFWADWRLILIGVILLSIQYLIIGGCYLTFLETGKDHKMTFYYYYLSKIFPTISKNKTHFFIRYCSPILILIVAYLLQVQFGWEPYLRLWF